MNNIIDKILTEPELQEKPPILVDIGASEQIHNKWKKIAKYSVCLAFDADERDFQFVEKEQDNFKKLLVYNSIASDKNINKSDFHLTKSPYCSSVLEPDISKLKPYIFSRLFKVEKKIELNSIHLQKALDDANLDYVDWFKTDSQGTDLRLFKSLKNGIRSKILVSEFEPGIIDAYKGEDKLYSVLEELTKSGFWLSDIKIKGTPRFPVETFETEFKGNISRKFVKESLKKAPGWGEMTFINSFDNGELGRREFLLGWLFSTLEEHHSFAFNLGSKGFEKFNYELFNRMKIYSKNQMKNQVYKLKFLPSVVEFIRKKIS